MCSSVVRVVFLVCSNTSGEPSEDILNQVRPSLDLPSGLLNWEVFKIPDHKIVATNDTDDSPATSYFDPSFGAACSYLQSVALVCDEFLKGLKTEGQFFELYKDKFFLADSKVIYFFH